MTIFKNNSCDTVALRPLPCKVLLDMTPYSILIAVQICLAAFSEDLQRFSGAGIEVAGYHNAQNKIRVRYVDRLWTFPNFIW
jgi:hypothetical protein